MAMLMAFTFARSQDFHYSPTSYPLQDEIVLKWAPIAPVEAPTLQPPTWLQEHKKGLIITGIQMASVFLDAGGDAVYDMGKESGDDSQMFWGHTMQAVAIGGMAVSVVSLSWRGSPWDGVKFGVGWLAMRYALHDLSYNAVRGLKWSYADGVKAQMPPGGIAFTQSVAFVFSVSWNIKEF